MKLSQKKNCNGCRAFYQSQEHITCKLKFKHSFVKTGVLRGIVGAADVGYDKPDEPCYKPKTYKELIEADRMLREVTHD